MHIKFFSTWLWRPVKIRRMEIAGGGLSFIQFPTRPTTGGDGGWQPTGIRPAVRGIILVCLIWHTHTHTHFAQQRARLVHVFVPGWERLWANDSLSVDAKYAKWENMIQNTKDLWHEGAAPARLLLACLPTRVIIRWHTYLPHNCHQITVLGIRKRVCVRHLSRRGYSLLLG